MGLSYVILLIYLSGQVCRHVVISVNVNKARYIALPSTLRFIQAWYKTKRALHTVGTQYDNLSMTAQGFVSAVLCLAGSVASLESVLEFLCNLSNWKFGLSKD